MTDPSLIVPVIGVLISLALNLLVFRQIRGLDTRLMAIFEALPALIDRLADQAPRPSAELQARPQTDWDRENDEFSALLAEDSAVRHGLMSLQILTVLAVLLTVLLATATPLATGQPWWLVLHLPLVIWTFVNMSRLSRLMEGTWATMQAITEIFPLRLTIAAKRDGIYGADDVEAADD